MAKSTYEIRVAGPVPLDLLENFHQIDTVEPAGTILHAVQLDDAALWGLIDALRNAGIDLIEIRREGYSTWLLDRWFERGLGPSPQGKQR